MVTESIIGWESSRLRLVPLESSKHLENTKSWINSQEVTEWMQEGMFPVSADETTEWFDEMQSKSAKGELAWFAIELLNGTHIGDTGLTRIDWRNGYANCGSLIGPPEFRNLGLGTEACQLRTWYCFHVLGLRLLESGYVEGNAASQRMQEKTGFEETIRIPGRFWMNGDYRDEVRTYLTKEKWLQISKGEKTFIL